MDLRLLSSSSFLTGKKSFCKLKKLQFLQKEMIYDFENHLQKTTVTLLGVKWYALLLLRQIKIVVEANLEKKEKKNNRLFSFAI